MANQPADNSSEFFEVPITNQKSNESDDDISYLINDVTADIASVDADINIEVPAFETKANNEIENLPSKYEEDWTNSIKINNVIAIDETSENHDTSVNKTQENLKEIAPLNVEVVKTNTEKNLKESGPLHEEDIVRTIGSETIDIDETEALEPLKTVNDPTKNKSLIILDSTVVINEKISEKILVIGEGEKIDNNLNKDGVAHNLNKDIIKKDAETINIDETKKTLEMVVDDLNRSEIDTESASLEIKPENSSIINDEATINIENTNDVDDTTDIEINNIKNDIDIEETEIQNEVVDIQETSEITTNETQTNNVTEDIDVDMNKTDSDVIILEERKTNFTIILDDDDNIDNKLTEQPVEVIDDDDKDCSIIESNIKTNSDVYKDYPLLLELVEKCLDMENTTGMARVINRTLLVIFKSADEDYKKSEEFKKFLTKTIMNLDVQPEKKFNHIKNLCNELKLHTAKKKVPLITLEKRNSTEESTSSVHIHTKRKVEVVIDLETATPSTTSFISSAKRRKKFEAFTKEYPPIEIDDNSSSDDINIVSDNDVILVDNYNSNKENTSHRAKRSKRKKKKKKDRLKVSVVKSSYENQPSTAYTSFTNRNENNTESLTNLCQENAFIQNNSNPRVILEPELTVQFEKNIQFLEAMIAQEKHRLEELEKAEVLTDCYNSPYVQCEVIKANILKLYKRLCLLTGTEVNKRHEVRLQVVPGHPEGPVSCLEEFLNNNIDEHGNPPFPDMVDVLHCVNEANTRYNMNWTHTQIVGEAHALFTQFGSKMQKRRQKREWKDLLSLVKDEVQDPADTDPELMAKLEQNTRLARKNEHDILERYVNLQHGRPDPELMLCQSGESDDDDDSDTNLGTETPDINPSKAVSVPSVVLNPMKANELSHLISPSGINNTILVPNVCELGNISMNGDKTLVNVNFGSTVTVCDGKIIIQPTVKYSTQSVGLPTNQLSPFSSEFKNFIYKNSEKPDTSVLPNEKFINLKTQSCIGLITNVHKDNPPLLRNNAQIANVAQNPENSEKTMSSQTVVSNTFVNTINIASENCRSQIVTDIQEKTDAAKLAKEILELVQSDLHSPSSSNNFFMTNPTLPINHTTVNANDPKISPNVIPTASNPDTLNNIESSKGFHIYTHTPKHKTQPIENSNSTVAIQNDRAEPIVTVPDVDSKDNIPEVVKREPLDIPSLLEELGEDYTATIFDIEDPFMVIEISDSSESEDEAEIL